MAFDILQELEGIGNDNIAANETVHGKQLDFNNSLLKTAKTGNDSLENQYRIF